ncbi:MAG: cytochrome c [Nitrospirota bacterium]
MRKGYLISFIIGLFVAAGYLPAPYAAESNPIKEGEELYQKNCSVCHGDKGDGNTWVSHELNPKPKNFTDPLVINVMTRKRMRDSVINGRQGTAMQAFKTQLSESEINLIIDYIQTAFMKIDIKTKKKK